MCVGLICEQVSFQFGLAIDRRLRTAERLRAQNAPADRPRQPAKHAPGTGLALVTFAGFLLDVKVAADVNPRRHRLLLPRGDLGQVDVLIATELGRVAAQ